MGALVGWEDGGPCACTFHQHATSIPFLERCTYPKRSRSSVELKVRAPLLPLAGWARCAPRRTLLHARHGSAACIWSLGVAAALGPPARVGVECSTQCAMLCGTWDSPGMC